MADTLQQLQALRQRAEQCRHAAAVAEATQAAARGDLAQLTQQLQAEFGFAPDQIPQMLERLEAEIAGERAWVEQALLAAEGRA